VHQHGTKYGRWEQINTITWDADVKENMQRLFRMDCTSKEHRTMVGSSEHKNEIPAIKREEDLDWFTDSKIL
jgi:hypothetical protein